MFQTETGQAIGYCRGRLMHLDAAVAHPITPAKSLKVLLAIWRECLEGKLEYHSDVGALVRYLATVQTTL